jgi:hypothetical protein
VEHGGKEVVGGGTEGGAEEGFSVQRSKCSVVPRASVVPSVKKMGEGDGSGAACGVEAGDVGYC